MKIEIRQREQDALTFQEYGSKPQIDGVFHHPLKKHRALEGSFMELYRITEGQVTGLPIAFEARQISLSWAAPGRINAFHLHPKEVQDEIWCAVGGELLVWLADVRASSPTEGHRRSYVLSGEEPAMLHIPSGIAHGYKAGPSGAMLLYAMNSQFNLSDPNEGRLPWDLFGGDIWEEDRG